MEEIVVLLGILVAVQGILSIENTFLWNSNPAPLHKSSLVPATLDSLEHFESKKNIYSLYKFRQSCQTMGFRSGSDLSL